MFELLAERWGMVTPQGRIIRLPLTHETLGSLIGARRPTVSLALGDLAERGEVVRQDGGWLLRHDITAKRLEQRLHPESTASAGADKIT